MPYRAGRHFLQLPGPTNVPDRVLRAMSRPLIDHRGSEFGGMVLAIQEELGDLFGAEAGVFIFPSSATGCWEAALANTLSPGDRVLLFDGGFFAGKWGVTASRLGLQVEALEGDWRRPVDAGAIEARLAEDAEGSIRAVLVVHNETSTGVTSDVAAVRGALDRTGHDALLMVDAVSSLGATEYRHDGWGVDVTVCGSQKGLMLPPGLAFTAVSHKALARNEAATIPRAYWDWGEMRRFNERGFFPYTPPTSLLFGLRESLAMLREEGLRAVFARHARHAEATRRAVAAWGLDNFCADPNAYSRAGTAVCVPEEANAEALRIEILDRFDMSVGAGLGPLQGRVFRIGHLGDLNDLWLVGALAGVEMGLRAARIPHRPGGVEAAMSYLGAA